LSENFIVTEEIQEVLLYAKENTVYKCVKGKGKVFPVLLTKHHTMKAYWGSGL